MDRARELFEWLEAGGLAALERLLAEEEPESLFLDYKRSETPWQSRIAPQRPRKPLESFVRFANSEGGLLIWGVDARREAGAQREIMNKAPVARPRPSHAD